MTHRFASTGTGGSAVAVSCLSKRFRTSWGRRVEALREVSFSVGVGEIYGLLGPNGAGKSTTLKILLGFMKPSAGEGTLLGERLGTVSVRRRVGFLPENPYFYDYLTAPEFLDTCASLAGLPRGGRSALISRTLERVGLEPGQKLRLRKFSKGMLQRVGLAQAIIHDPELLILDEPMSGLDPIGRRQVRDLILELRREGKTVVFSSHVLPDVEALCERVAMLVGGELRQEGRVADLLRHDQGGFEIEVRDLPPSLAQAWAAQSCLRECGDRLIVSAPDQSALEERVQQIFRAGATLLGVKPIARSLEDVFLAEVGGQPGLPSASITPGHREEAA